METTNSIFKALTKQDFANRTPDEVRTANGVASFDPSQCLSSDSVLGGMFLRLRPSSQVSSRRQVFGQSYHVSSEDIGYAFDINESSGAIFFSKAGVRDFFEMLSIPVIDEIFENTVLLESLIEYAVRKFLFLLKESWLLDQNLNISDISKFDVSTLQAEPVDVICFEYIPLDGGESLNESAGKIALQLVFPEVLQRQIYEYAWPNLSWGECGVIDPLLLDPLRLLVGSIFLEPTSLITFLQAGTEASLQDSSSLSDVALFCRYDYQSHGEIFNVGSKLWFSVDRKSGDLRKSQVGTTRVDVLLRAVGVDQSFLRDFPKMFPLDVFSFPQVVLEVGGEIVAFGELGQDDAGRLSVKVSSVT